jgi:outer membrane protein assembly factor BamB
MNRNRIFVAVAVSAVLFAAVAWRARHRVRDLLDQHQKERNTDSLRIDFDKTASHSGAPPLKIEPEDVPWWRARAVFGSPNAGVALTWSDSKNVLWKTPVPGRGHSSPCVLGERIILTTADADEGTQHVLCLSLITGKVDWTREVHRGKFVFSNTKNSQASPTAATDGSLVFVSFVVDEAVWLSALTLKGEVSWQTEVGPFVSKEGFGASPLIAGDAVIVAADNVGPSWLAAVHRASGEILWRLPRGAGNSYATPVVQQVGQEEHILLAGIETVTARRVRDGGEVWTIPGPVLSASTPAIGDGLLFVTGCTPESGISGIRLSNPPETLWNHRIKVEVPSPLYSDGLVYLTQDLGIMLCVEAETGKVVWRKRLGGNAASSPILVGDRILQCMEDGRTVILRAGRDAEVLGENMLDEGILATPVLSRGRLLIRTLGHIYCIGDAESPGP